MGSPQRKKFRTVQDWNDFLGSNQGKVTGQSLLEFRRACYRDIERLRERPLLIYATSFLNPLPPGVPNFIDLADVDGFTDLVNSAQGAEKVDILLHSPGGRPDATERIVNILRSKFTEVTFLIPHSAYSAATMLAFSGDNIILHPSATLGPIDPQINGIPARSIIRGFEKVKEKIAKEGPQTLPAYIPLIEKYSLDLLELCEDSEKLSRELATTWLKQYMFRGENNNGRKISKAVKFFSSYDKHLLHSRPISFSKLQGFDLKVEVSEPALEELLWEAYILISGFFNASPFVKLYENAKDVSWGKQFQQILMPTPPPQQKLKK